MASAGRTRHRARNTLVVAEVALAVILLVASGLMIRTFQAMGRVDPGFKDPEKVLTLRVAIPGSMVKDPVQTARMHQQIQRAIEQVPGVSAVGLSSSLTMDGFDSNDPIFVEDFPTPEGRIPPLRRFKWIGEHYFKTMGNRIIAGRDIEWRDVETVARHPGRVARQLEIVEPVGEENDIAQPFVDEREAIRPIGGLTVGKARRVSPDGHG